MGDLVPSGSADVHAWYPPPPHDGLPSMILLTLQMRRVMMRLMASQGLLGPLATVEATMGARDSTMTAPSNT